MTFRDHFSSQASDYAKYRPDYPLEAFAFLAKQVRSHKLAWDVGTGNGQAALRLAEFFDTVIAMDPSEAQLKNSVPHPKLRYRVGQAEASGLENHSIDLITVAQAVHWFRLDEFYQEVRRVAKPNAVIGLLTYELPDVSPEVDLIMKHFYSKIVGPYWPKERAWVTDRYESLPFPFHRIEAPSFRCDLQGELEFLLGYFFTWSATQGFIKDKGQNPIDLIRADMERAWGDPKQVKKISWMVALKVGRIS